MHHEASTVSVGSKRCVVCINSAGEIFKEQADGHWDKLPGSGDSVSTAGDQEMFACKDGKLFRWVGGEEEKVWSSVPCEDPKSVYAGSETAIIVMTSGGKLQSWNCKDEGDTFSEIAGSFKDVAVGADGTLLVIAEDGRACVHDGAPVHDWKPINGDAGTAKTISAGSAEHLLLMSDEGRVTDLEGQEKVADVISADIGADGAIYYINTAGQLYSLIDGAAKQVYDPELKGEKLTLVGVGNAGQLVVVTQSNKMFNLVDDRFRTLPAPAGPVISKVSIGHDGSLVVLNAGRQLFQWTKDAWTRMPGTVLDFSVGSKDNIYATAQNGEVFHWQGGVFDATNASYDAPFSLPHWRLVGSGQAMIAAGADGHLLTVDQKKNLQVGESPEDVKIAIDDLGVPPGINMPEPAPYEKGKARLDPATLKKMREQRRKLAQSAKYVPPEIDYEGTPEAKSDVYKFLADVNACTLFSEAPEEVFVTTDHVQELFAGSGASSSCLSHLHRFEELHRKFNSVDELVLALKKEHSDSIKGRGLAFDFLGSPKCNLFPDGEWILPTDIDRLFDEGKAGSETVRILRRLNKSGAVFYSFEELLQGIIRAPVAEAQRARVVSYLLGPAPARGHHAKDGEKVYLTIQPKSGSSCSFISDPNERVSNKDIDVLMMCCDPTASLSALMNFHAEEKYFDDFEGLLAALEEAAPKKVMSSNEEVAQADEHLSWTPLPGSGSQIAVASSEFIACVDGDGRIQRWTGRGWEEISSVGLEGGVRSLDVGVDGSMYAVGEKESKLHKYYHGSSEWREVPKVEPVLAVSVADKDNIVCTAESGSALLYSVAEGQFVPLAEFDHAQLTVGVDGSVWSVKKESGEVRKWDATGSKWNDIVGEANYVSLCDHNTVYMQKKADNQVYKWQKIEGTEASFDDVWELVDTSDPHSTIKVDAQIRVGVDGTIGAVSTDNQLVVDSAEVLELIAFPGSANQIGCGSAKHLVALGSSGELLKWGEAFHWEKIAGSASQIDVGADGDIWNIDQAGNIYRFDSISWQIIPSESPDSSIKMISVGDAENIATVDEQGGIRLWDGENGTWLAPIESSADTSAISIGNDGELWLLTSERAIKRYHKDDKTWVDITGDADLIAVGCAGQVYIADKKSNSVLKYTGIESNDSAIGNALPVWKVVSVLQQEIASLGAGADGSVAVCTIDGEVKVQDPVQHDDFVIANILSSPKATPIQEKAPQNDEEKKEGGEEEEKQPSVPAPTYNKESIAHRFNVANPRRDAALLDEWLALGLSCKALQREQGIAGETTDPFIEVYTTRRGHLELVGATEVVENTINPAFGTLAMRMSSLCFNDPSVKLTLRVMDKSSTSGAWAKPTLIGQVAMSVADVQKASENGLEIQLTRSDGGEAVSAGSLFVARASVCHKTARGVVQCKGEKLFDAEEVESFLRLVVSGNHLPEINAGHKDKGKGTDSYLEVFALTSPAPGGEWERVYTSEIVARSCDPSYRDIILPLSKLCQGVHDAPLLVKCWASMATSSGDRLMGSFVTSVRGLVRSPYYRYALNARDYSERSAWKAILEHPQASRYQQRQAKQIVEEYKPEETLWLKFKAEGLAKWSGISQSQDPYLELYRYRHNHWESVSNTNHIQDNASPSWYPLIVNVSDLNNDKGGKDKSKVLIKVWSYHKKQPASLIGEVEITIKDLKEAQTFALQHALDLNDVKAAGKLVLEQSRAATADEIDAFDEGTNQSHKQHAHTGGLLVQSSSILTTAEGLDSLIAAHKADKHSSFHDYTFKGPERAHFLDFLAHGAQSTVQTPALARRLRHKASPLSK